MDCPCTNCITYIICKNKVTETLKKRKTIEIFYSDFYRCYCIISSKCSLLTKFMIDKNKGRNDFNFYCVEHIKDVF